MNFIDSFRMERIYFEKLKNNITDIKNLLAAGNTEDALILLQNSVDVDGAVLLLYRNLGECWAELADQIKKTREELDALKEATEAYHDELNEKIDNINFVLVRLINALDARLTIVENDLATMPRVKFLSLVYDETESEYQIQDSAGNVLTYDDISELAEFPHFVVLTDANGNYYIPKSFDESVIVWHIDEYNTTFDVYSDISVVIDSDDYVTLSESTLPKLFAGNGIVINSDNEIEVDTTVIQEKLTAGTGIDIDSNNEISVDFNDVQEKLTAGAGIDIDSNNEISVDFNDVQEKLIAGTNITLTPDSTDPTKTVIDASGGGGGYPYYDTSTTLSSAQNFNLDKNDVPTTSGYSRYKNFQYSPSSGDGSHGFYEIKFYGSELTNISGASVDVKDNAHFSCEVTIKATMKKAPSTKYIYCTANFNIEFAYNNSTKYKRQAFEAYAYLNTKPFVDNGYTLQSIDFDIRTHEVYNMDISKISELFASQINQNISYVIKAYD